MWCSQTTAQIQLPSRLAARLILLLLLLLQTRVADGGAACSCALPGIYFIHHTASKHIKHTEIWCVQQLCVRGIYIVKSTRCGHIRFLFSMLNPPSLPPSLSASLPPSLPPSSPLSLSLYDPPPLRSTSKPFYPESGFRVLPRYVAVDKRRRRRDLPAKCSRWPTPR